MKAVYITLLFYCALAAVAIIVLIMLNSQSLAKLRNSAIEMETELNESRQDERWLAVQTAELESNQRRGRAGFTGEEAVVASLEVQESQELSAQARMVCDLLESRYTERQQEIQALRLRYLPLVILLLVHIIGALVLLPYIKPKL